MVVVSNTSPLLNLAAIGHLDLAHRLFNQIIIPESVYNEITVSGIGNPGDREIRSVDWIIIKKPSKIELVNSLLYILDPGEAESLALAVELGADLILLDERKARAVAKQLELNCIGLLGILIHAKRNGHITAVKPLLQDLVNRAGFWVSNNLYEQILKVVNEP